MFFLYNLHQHLSKHTSLELFNKIENILLGTLNFFKHFRNKYNISTEMYYIYFSMQSIMVYSNDFDLKLLIYLIIILSI